MSLKALVKLDPVIQPGDTIHAELKYLGNNTYKLSLDDVTRGEPFTIDIVSAKPIRSSAEWIEESTGQLADFKTVMFTNATATAMLPTGNHTGPISDAAWQTEESTLVGKSGGVLACTTS